MLGNLRGALSQFEWTVLWSPYYALILVGLYILYAVVTEKLRRPDEPETTLGQKFSMLAALVVFYIGFGSPLDLLA
ncbi:MAG TPA: cytochrome C oxidase assembly protein, partial [Exiguobacterium sp.]|nr:cytochrome C oxidase assembly protein [Exiguobacterium sp.]